ncbi:conserved hypothetical protein [Ricinus communis]|uniref:Uncharacterized protein n=1 Tax=Ricinus communis TaxID=3988 RepID=B9T814_RICCO|nr:conserved hypothetical protein [Ricinus communis]
MEYGKTLGAFDICHIALVVHVNKSVSKCLLICNTFKFLNGVNESYQAIRSRIIIMKPFPTINQAYNMVIREEKQRSLLASPQNFHESAAMAVKKSISDLYCTQCWKSGHLKDKCYKIIGFPPDFKFTKGKNKSRSHVVVVGSQ